MTDPFLQLERHLIEIADLQRIQRLLAWDQQTMMPRAGAHHRADQLGTLRRISHRLLGGDETARLLDAVRPYEESLDPDSNEARLLWLARRDHEKARRVPADLAAEMTRAAAEARQAWVQARADSDFAAFLPALEHNFTLRLRYIECFDDVEDPYDVLLDDFEPDTSTADVRAIFDEVKAEVVPLIAALRDRDVDDSFLHGEFPPERQERLAKEIVALLGLRPDTWRLDPTEHPFASGAGIDDVRITTVYDGATLKFLFSTIHEYGHGLYNHQIPREFARLPIGMHASLGLHESQSRLWENLVGRGLPFWRFFYPRLQQAFPERLADVELDRFYAAVNRVHPGLIRIRADEVTYGMHVILRFELEQDVVNGRVAVGDLPEAWNAKMREYLGVDVPNDADGVLQDTHWASGLIGYFSTYLLGTIMSVQIWEQANEDLPELADQLERGEFAPLREWLGEHVHALGRKYPPQETLQRAIGSTIDAKPYLAYLQSKYGAGVAA